MNEIMITLTPIELFCFRQFFIQVFYSYILHYLLGYKNEYKFSHVRYSGIAQKNNSSMKFEYLI